MAGKTKCSVELDIGPAPEVKVISHSQMRGHLKAGRVGVLLEYVDAKLLLQSIEADFSYDKNKKPIELSAVKLKLKYRATIFMSDVIPKGSKCWKAVMEHATEHHDINVAALKGIGSKSGAILGRFVEKMLSDFKNDLVALQRKESATLTELAKKASGKIQDELFVPILKKSAAIDTESNYRPIDLVCTEYM